MAARAEKIVAADTDSEMANGKRKKQEGGWGDTVRTIVYALLIAFVVRTVAFQPFNIPSGSMIPTLLIGDYLFVSKYSYGYSRYSLPIDIPLFSGRIFEQSPERGDVAVFRHPPDNHEDFIKRIVGIPGDHIQMIGGVLHINGKAVEKHRIEDFVQPVFGGRTRLIPRYVETLPNGVSYSVLEMLGDTGPEDNTPEFVVPAGEYFAMGDNRDDSNDSRSWGYVPLENFIGRAEIIFFSTDGSAGWLQPWRWPGAIRYSRIFELIR